MSFSVFVCAILLVKRVSAWGVAARPDPRESTKSRGEKALLQGRFRPPLTAVGIFWTGSVNFEESGKILTIHIQGERIDLSDVSRLYPAAIIRYADGTVTQISIEWYDETPSADVELLHYAICVHFKEEERAPALFPCEDRETLEEEIAALASQLNG